MTTSANLVYIGTLRGDVRTPGDVSIAQCIQVQMSPHGRRAEVYRLACCQPICTKFAQGAPPAKGSIQIQTAIKPTEIVGYVGSDTSTHEYIKS